MQTISVQTAQNIPIQYPLASIGDRILARLIDVLIIAAWAVVWGFIIGLSGSELGIIILMLFIYIPAFFYPLLCEYFLNGQTIGKRSMRIKVVKIDGSRPTFGSYFLRWLLLLIDQQIFGIIGIVLISSSDKGQRLGDIAASTTVIKLQEIVPLTSAQLIKETVNKPKDILYPEVSKLSSKDVEIIEQAIKIYRSTGNTEPILATDKKIRNLLGINPDQLPVDFLPRLIKDYYALAD